MTAIDRIEGKIQTIKTDRKLIVGKGENFADELDRYVDLKTDWRIAESVRYIALDAIARKYGLYDSDTDAAEVSSLIGRDMSKIPPANLAASIEVLKTDYHLVYREANEEFGLVEKSLNKALKNRNNVEMNSPFPDAKNIPSIPPPTVSNSSETANNSAAAMPIDIDKELEELTKETTENRFARTTEKSPSFLRRLHDPNRILIPLGIGSLLTWGTIVAGINMFQNRQTSGNPNVPNPPAATNNNTNDFGNGLPNQPPSATDNTTTLPNYTPTAPSWPSSLPSPTASLSPTPTTSIASPSIVPPPVASNPPPPRTSFPNPTPPAIPPSPSRNPIAVAPIPIPGNNSTGINDSPNNPTADRNNRQQNNEINTPNNTRDKDQQTSGRNNLSQADAVNLIERWMVAKKRIFAPPYDHQLGTNLLAGKAYRDNIQGPASNGDRLSSREELRNNKQAYTYRRQKIKRIVSFTPNDRGAIVKVLATEEIALNGKRITNPPSVYTYRIERENGRWKIFDYHSRS